MACTIALSASAADKPPFNAQDCYKELCRLQCTVPKEAYQGVFLPLSGNFADTVSWSKTGLQQEVPDSYITRMRSPLRRGTWMRNGGRLGTGLGTAGFALVIDGCNRLPSKKSDAEPLLLIFGSLAIGSSIAWRLGSILRRPAAQWFAARTIKGVSTSLPLHRNVQLTSLTRFAANKFTLPPQVNVSALNKDLLKNKWWKK